ncbi:MAG: hypothetical protein R3F53_15630 [Gammaproteobacteria bacterium]
MIVVAGACVVADFCQPQEKASSQNSVPLLGHPARAIIQSLSATPVCCLYPLLACRAGLFGKLFTTKRWVRGDQFDGSANAAGFPPGLSSQLVTSISKPGTINQLTVSMSGKPAGSCRR